MTQVEAAIKDWASAVADYVAAPDNAKKKTAEQRIVEAFERIKAAPMADGDDVWFKAAENFMKPLIAAHLLD